MPLRLPLPVLEDFRGRVGVWVANGAATLSARCMRSGRYSWAPNGPVTDVERSVSNELDAGGLDQEVEGADNDQKSPTGRSAARLQDRDFVEAIHTH